MTPQEFVLKEGGLDCNSQSGVLHNARRARFIVDIERGASVSYRVSESTTIRLRYEPWIMPYDQARQTLDPLFFGRGGKSALSPDIVFELISGREAVGSPASVRYAVVIDAKYARRIQERHWNQTDKYLRVQSTANLKQVVRQLWLVHPGSDADPIFCRDNVCEWTSEGPNCAAEDVVEGVILLAPSKEMHPDNTESGWIGRPEPTAARFIAGLLRFLQKGGMIE